jgi:hypothetical protein
MSGDGGPAVFAGPARGRGGQFMGTFRGLFYLAR